MATWLDLKHLFLGEKDQEQMRCIKVPFIYFKKQAHKLYHIFDKDTYLRIYIISVIY